MTYFNRQSTGKSVSQLNADLQARLRRRQPVYCTDCSVQVHPGASIVDCVVKDWTASGKPEHRCLKCFDAHCQKINAKLKGNA